MNLSRTPEINAYNVDCMEFMADKPDNYYDLAIVDPPYGLNLKGENPIKNKSDTKKFDTSWDANTPPREYFDLVVSKSKNQVIWGGNYFLDHLGYCKAPIIWDKLNGGSLYADGELAWTGGDGVPKNLKIWRHQWCGAFKDSERGVINIHPTQKPIALYRWLLKNYAKPGDRILDTHGGSMSIAIACHMEGFDLDVCEIDEEYYYAAIERFRLNTVQEAFDFA